MLRLARLRPLATSVTGWGHYPKFYSTEPTPTPTPSQSAADTELDNILKDIQKASIQTPRSTINQQFSNNTTNTTLPVNQDSQLHSLSFTEYSDTTFGDNNYTTRSYDRFLDVYPALKHEVDTQKLHAKLKYEQIYLKDLAHEPKTVFKFKNVVTKNYRTISRSWPMARLNEFKYGHDHFVDEMYDDIAGKYYWNNQLAYPDGSINLFCGTSSKGSPVKVKGDPLALTYDDSLHNSETIKPVRLQISKKEAEARFPHLLEREKVRKKAETGAKTEAAPSRASLASKPIPELETEAEEDARKSLEKEASEKRDAKKQLKAQAGRKKYLSQNVEETIPERKARWRWETMEDERRPWRTLTNRGVHRSWDDRVLYDPVTMVRLVSFSARGRMIERYYYRDELTTENTSIGTSRSDPELDPDYDPKTKLIEHREKNDWQLETTSIKDPETEEAYCPKDQDAYENARHKVATELLPKREKAEPESKVEYKQKELRKDLLDEGVLPVDIREGMIKTFKELVEEGALKQEDEWTYYNDYVRLTAKAMSRARAEEYRKNKVYNSPNVQLPGMYHVNPIYYFKYIKINLAEGWIRFYVGEHNRVERQLENELDCDFILDSDRDYNNTMEYPFVWRYSQYKLSPEDIAAMKEVKWPPSLVPPPTSSLQVGDGSPEDQLAQYFERTYLQFGHDVRFNPTECFDPAYDKLEDPNLKYLRSVGPSASDVQFVPDPGHIDLSSRTNLTPEERAREDARLRGVIRRAASESMERETETMVSAYAGSLVMNQYYAKKSAEMLPEFTNGHSMLWLADEYPTADPDLVPSFRIRDPATRFRQKGDVVYAYDSTNQKIIQEYQGYRLKITPTMIRIVRLPNHPDAKVIFYDERGNKERTEYHPQPNIDFHVSSDRLRDRTGRSAWAFTSDAYAEIAATHGLPNKRAQEIQKAEQHRAEALTEALRELEGADAWNEGVEEKDAEDDVLYDILNDPKK